MQPIFITGIGTNVGKTVISAIITEALEADYWKPVQTGLEEGTDAATIKYLISNKKTHIYPELYSFSMAASPHLAAKAQDKRISVGAILDAVPKTDNTLIIEGPGGILVPLNEREFVTDLIKKLNARVILVSRNYLGSINHSLLTAAVCKSLQIDVCGWMFNDQFMNYGDEIVEWSEIPKISSIPFLAAIDKASIHHNAQIIQENLKALL